MQIFFRDNKRAFINRLKKIERNKRRKLLKPKFDPFKLVFDYQNVEPPLLEAPVDCQLSNMDEVLEFIYSIRHYKSIGKINSIKAVKVSLKNVKKIDFAVLNIIKSIGEELRQKVILLYVDLPENKDCKKYLIDSGFLDYMYDSFGKKFPKTHSSEEIIFEKGFGKLTTTQNKKITMLIKNMMHHLTGAKENFSPLKKTILELCGNSIEHAYSMKGQWSLSVKYEGDHVIITVTDLGRGILDTLYRKHSTEIKEMFKSRDQILSNAFFKKYGSSTQEENRNKGLPMIKSIHDRGIIEDLIVVTNDVFLPLNGEVKPRVFKNTKTKFRGTFYQWKVSKNAINNYKNGTN